MATIAAWTQAPAPVGQPLVGLDWWKYPIEKNPLQRLPTLNRDLYAVAMSADGQHIIAVGESGAVLTSHDGGHQWTTRDSRTESDLKSVALSADGKRAIAVGKNGVVLLSMDAGNSWEDKTPVHRSSARKSLILTNQSVGRSIEIARKSNSSPSTVGTIQVWVDEEGRLYVKNEKEIRRTAAKDTERIFEILKTRNNENESVSAYEMFKALNLLTDFSIESIDSVVDVSISADGSKAFVIGEDGSISTSADGGESWGNPTSFGIANGVGVAARADGSLVFGIQEDGDFVVGNPNKNSWSVKPTSGVWPPSTERFYGPYGTSIEYYEFGMATAAAIAASQDGARLVAVGRSGGVIVSDDGGVTWKSKRIGVPDQLHDVAISSDGFHVIAVGAGGDTYVSTDGGDNWAANPSRSKLDLHSVSLSRNGQRAVAVGAGGVIRTSRDGGKTWSTSANYHDRRVAKLALSQNGLKAVAVLADGRIFRSIDGGKAWASILDETAGVSAKVASYRVTDAKISDAGTEIAVALSDGSLINSQDGGKNWELTRSDLRAQYHNGEIGFAAICCNLDGLVVAGGGPKLRVRRNPKSQWEQIDSPSPAGVIGLKSSIDGRFILVGGSFGDLYVTNDGGASWSTYSRSKQEGIAESDIWLFQNYGFISSISWGGRSAVVLTEKVAIYTTESYGENWTSRRVDKGSEFNDVAISGGKGLVMAVSDDGHVHSLRRGSNEWSSTAIGSKEALQAIAISENGSNVIVGGAQGSVFYSSDGGGTWNLGLSVKDHARYPAPWYYIAFVLCGLLLLRGLSGRPGDVPHGAAAIAATDAPAGSLNQDRLDFAHLARGISRFLRNTETRPPLTLAITGEWGSGKSSLMGQVCDDLKVNGWRPVWFNAWHHQNEEQLLAALLMAVRDVGVPSWHSPSGFGFRLNLLLIRARRNMMASMLVLTVAALVVSFIMRYPDATEWQGLLAMFQTLKTKGTATDANALQAVLPLLGAIGVLVAIGHTMRAFGVDPAVLLSSTMARFKLKDANAQTSFRMRFAEQFGDVTDALGAKRRIVIVVDDLDRCEPDTVRKVMEAVNFLTASGKCFVMFGMATSRVLAALALSFKDIANELVQFDEAGGDERKRRQDYARDYLDKLVNIEILVPKRTDLPPTKLLEQQNSPVLAPLAAIAAEIKRWWLLLPVATAIALGWWLASLMSLPKVPERTTPPMVEQQQPPAQPTPEKPAPDSGEADQGPSPQQAERKPAPEPNALPVLVPGVDRGISPMWFLLAFSMLALIGGALFLTWLRRYALLVVDTEAFRKALEIWTPVATYHRNSPRSIKRFGNRIRYLAMLQQGHELDEQPAWIRAIQLLKPRLNWATTRLGIRLPSDVPHSPHATGTDASDALPEHLVVALGALHALFGENWRSRIPPYIGQVDSDLRGILERAVAEHRNIPDASWPPTEQQMAAFERSLNGVRLSGDHRMDRLQEALKAKSDAENGVSGSMSDLTPSQSG